MRTILALLFTCGLTFAVLPDKLKDAFINLRSNFEKQSRVCNIYDEANYCQQIVVDNRISLVAVSFKCECPPGWVCPSDPSGTAAYTDCTFIESKFWRKCQMKCTPDYDVSSGSSESTESSTDSSFESDI
ncbi:hypothetical protein Q1695_005230 [Nippostrongylus brasiliensis]|nr:hypothetical protein Q1695_005230 [Nippostrongylus brasiliensis]